MMCIVECLAYADLEIKITQQKQLLLLEIKGDTVANIHLTLNYLQAKGIAERLLATAGQIQLKEFQGSNTGYLFGHLQVAAKCEPEKEEKTTTKEMEKCLPSSLFAPMKNKFQSKAV